jgi:fused signal recognition particle receptor
MRFWRRNVPADPAADHQGREAEAAAAELQQPDLPAPEADEIAPPPPGETASQSAAAESAARHSWWQRNLRPPPVSVPEAPPPAAPETPVDPPEGRRAEPRTEEAAELNHLEAEHEPAGEGVSALRRPAPEELTPQPPEAREVASSQGSEPWSWLRRRTLPETLPSEAVPEPAPAADDSAELRQPEAEVEQVAAPPFEPATEEIATPPSEPGPETAEAAERRGWFGRLRAGLSRSSARLNEGINAIFNRRRLDDAALEELEELLISSDMGIGVAGEVTETLRRTRFNQEVAPEEVRMALAEQVIRLIEPVTRPLRIDHDKKPFVILVIGVNGSGKTTTIAKLARQYRDQGMAVVLAAGDTFRAAAVEQLQIWGERTGCPVVARPNGADAAGLAYDALVQARAEGADILLIDTAGRLQNKADLMGELLKIVRVLKKVDASAPHSVLLVLDATTGQNAHSQAEIFREMVGVTGIVMTKLDGTARGGVLVSLAEKYGIPIHAIGVGESADDLRPFEARAYARSLVGLEP